MKLIKKIVFIAFIFSLLFFSINSIYADNATDVPGSDLQNSTEKTFTDLSEKINSGDNITLTECYKFDDADGELKDGIYISKNMTITGSNGSYIDGNGKARGLYIGYNCNVTIKDLIIKNCFSEMDGAGILLSTNSTLTLENCTFTNNKVYNANGGALYACNNTSVYLFNSLFENNTSIRVSNAEWKEFKRGMGSAICAAYGNNINLVNTIFRGNNAYLATVLVVSFNEITREYKLSTLSVDNCLFESNYAYSTVSIYLDEMGKGEIKNSIFRKNKADNSGNVILDASISALVENCLFEENVAETGGAIHTKVFEYDYRSNVTIKDCNFTKNRATSQGGAFFAKYGLTKIINCRFTENDSPHGGAVYTKFSTIEIVNSTFDKNTADYGGALFLRSDENYINNNVFKNNIATGNGGAIHSKMDGIHSSGCIYINNKAPNGPDVYGVFFAKITKIVSYFNDVRITIKLTSPWNMPLSQYVKLTFKGSKTYKTGWLKTDSKGLLTLAIPFDMNTDKYSITLSFKSGLCNQNPTLTVSKAPCVLVIKKFTTDYKYGDKWKFYVKNSKTNKAVANAKLNLKVYTGKKYTVYKVTSNSKGFVTFNPSKLSVGPHKVIITRQNTNINMSKTTTSIKIKKVNAKITAPKKVKKSSKIKIIVKDKSTGKVIKKTKFKLRIYSGNDFKTVNVKSNAQGVFKVSTNKLSKGPHKFTLILKNSNFKIKNNFKVNIR